MLRPLTLLRICFQENVDKLSEKYKRFGLFLTPLFSYSSDWHSHKDTYRGSGFSS